MSVHIHIAETEINPEELGAYRLMIQGKIDEETLHSQIAFTLLDMATGRENVGVAHYDEAGRYIPAKMEIVNVVGDVILCALPRLAIFGGVRAAQCMARAVANAPRGDYGQIALLFARCMGQARADFIAQALEALLECSIGGAGGSPSDDN